MSRIPKNHPISAEVGRRLRTARTMHGLSRKELAEALEVPITHQQLQKYETGGNNPNIVRLCEIANVLQIPITYFVEGLEETENGFSPVDVSLSFSKEEMWLLRVYRSLSPANRRMIYNFLQKFPFIQMHH